MAGVNREWIHSIWRAVETGQRIRWADFGWYAVDRRGSIGMLTSAGSGPIPRSVFRDLDTYLDLRSFFEDLPPNGRSEIVREIGHVDDWHRAAERGLYGLDYQAGSGRYHMITRPEKPLQVEELPQWGTSCP